MLVQRLADGEVGGERQRGVGLLHRAHRPKLEREIAVGLLDHLLLRRIDAHSAPRLLGRLDAARQLGEPGGQILRSHGRIAKLGAAPDDRPLGAVEARRAVAPTRTANTIAGLSASGNKLAAPSLSTPGYSLILSSGM